MIKCETMKELLQSRTLRTATAISMSTLALVACGNNKANTSPDEGAITPEPMSMAEANAQSEATEHQRKLSIDALKRGVKRRKSTEDKIDYLAAKTCTSFENFNRNQFGETAAATGYDRFEALGIYHELDLGDTHKATSSKEEAASVDTAQFTQIVKDHCPDVEINGYVGPGYN